MSICIKYIDNLDNEISNIDIECDKIENISHQLLIKNITFDNVFLYSNTSKKSQIFRL